MAISLLSPASLFVQSASARSQTSLASSVERLASGTRLRHAQDDASGLGISQMLTASSLASKARVKNANDQISVAQTADAALRSATEVLSRMRSLVAGARNQALSSVQRQSIGRELTQLGDELNQIASRTQFNGKNLLSGRVGGLIAPVASAQSSPLAIGQVLAGDLRLTNLDTSNANQGRYSLRVIHDEPVVGQQSLVSASFASSDQVQTLVFDGTWDATGTADSISLSIGVDRWGPLTVDYQVSVADIQAGDQLGMAAGPNGNGLVQNTTEGLAGDDAATQASIARGVAKAINRAALDHGLQVVASARGGQVVVGGAALSSGPIGVDVREKASNIGLPAATVQVSSQPVASVPQNILEATDRLIAIDPRDVSVGNVFRVSMRDQTFEEVVSASDTPESIAKRLGVQIQNYMGIDTSVASASLEIDQQGSVNSREFGSVSFSGLASGQSATVNGLTFTATEDLSANEVARAFQNLTDGVTGNSLNTFKHAAHASYDVGFAASGLAAGQSVTVGGITITANLGTVTRQELVDAFENLTGGGAANPAPQRDALAYDLGALDVLGGVGEDETVSLAGLTIENTGGGSLSAADVVSILSNHATTLGGYVVGGTNVGTVMGSYSGVGYKLSGTLSTHFTISDVRAGLAASALNVARLDSGTDTFDVAFTDRVATTTNSTYTPTSGMVSVDLSGVSLERNESILIEGMTITNGSATALSGSDLVGIVANGNRPLNVTVSGSVSGFIVSPGTPSNILTLVGNPSPTPNVNVSITKMVAQAPVSVGSQSVYGHYSAYTSSGSLPSEWRSLPDDAGIVRFQESERSDPTMTQAISFAGAAASVTGPGVTAYGSYSGTFGGGPAGTTKVNTGALSFPGAIPRVNFTALTPGNMPDLLATVTSGTITVNTTQGSDLNRTEIQTFSFEPDGLGAGYTATIGGLSFTAARDLTPTEAASAFSGLTDGAVSGPATALGTYSGQFAAAGWGSTSPVGQRYSWTPWVYGDTQTTDTLTGTAQDRGGTITIQQPTYATQLDTNFGFNVERPDAEIRLEGSMLSVGGYRGLGLEDMSVSVSRTLDKPKFQLQAFAVDGSERATEVIVSTGADVAKGAGLRFESLGINLDVEQLTASAQSRPFQNQRFDFDVVGSAVDLESMNTSEDLDLRLGSLNSGGAEERGAFVRLGELVNASMTADGLGELVLDEMAGALDRVFDKVVRAATGWGVSQNRLESEIANLSEIGDHASATLSRVVDVDYGKETAKMAAIQIMQQASTAAMAQANQMPNVILALLKQ